MVGVALMSLWGCVAPPEGVLDVGLHTGPGLRDLEAVVAGVATFRWFEDGVLTDLRSRVVPADAVWPGSTWTVEAVDSAGRMGTASVEIPEPPGGNVLVVLLDDVGVDKVGAYGNSWAARTPTLDGLAEDGIRFTRAWASSVCSPTRGSLLTGRHPRRTGMGWVADTGSRSGSVPLAAHTIPEVLRGGRHATWSNAALGKWHIAGPQAAGFLTHPNDQGFDHYAGSPGNPDYAPDRGYFAWTKNVDGTLVESTTYMTTDTADDAIAQLASLPEPFFLYVAFNAPHGPLHRPPPHLLSAPLPGADITLVDRYDAMLEAADTELGRILDSVDPALLSRTTVIALGDNGTMGRGVPPGIFEERYKHTPYQGGVNVPFIVTGPHVGAPGTVSDALIHVVDILPTVAEIAGVPLAGPEGDHVVLADGSWHPLDGRSLLPVLAGAEGRDVVYTEAFHPNQASTPNSWQRTVRDATHKLVRWTGHPDELYRLEGPLERDVRPLTGWRSREDREALVRLESVLARYEDALTYEGM